MSLNDFHITWFDCGGTAGMAHLCIGREAFSRPERKILSNLRWWDCQEFSGAETDVLRACVAHVDSILTETSFLDYHVGGEDFDKTNTPGSKENLFSPVRQNAVLDWECAKRGLTYRYQARQIRRNITKERLTLFGFEGKFRKDEFAALQHAIVYARRLKQESLRRPWKLNTPDIHSAYWDCACQDGKEHDLIHG